MRIGFVGQIRSPESDIYSDLTPLGTMLLAQMARQRGHEVKKIEVRIDRPHDWKRDLLEFQPQVLCFTVFTNVYYFYEEIFRECRKLLPDLKMIIGGPHVSGVRQWVLEDSPELDYGVYGEGERAFLALLDHFEGKGTPLSSVPNLIYREGGQIHVNCAAPELTSAELDQLPYAAYDLLPEFDFRSRFGPKAMVITSRGCYFRCKFCYPEFIGEGVRSHSPKYVIGWIRMLREQYGLKYLQVLDALFPPKRKWLDEFLDLWEQEKFDGLKWAFTTRVKYITEEHYKRMKRLGLLFVPVGVEAADDEILKDIDKEIMTADVEATLRMLRRLGLPAITNFIIGHRLDTPETVGKILPFLLRTMPHAIQVSALIPLPGTPVYDLVPEERKRFYLRPWDFPSINQRGFAKTKAEYEHLCADIRVRYYSSLRYLWNNGVLWSLRNPADDGAKSGVVAAFHFWKTYTPKYLAGMAERVPALRPVVRGVRRALGRAPA